MRVVLRGKFARIFIFPIHRFLTDDFFAFNTFSGSNASFRYIPLHAIIDAFGNHPSTSFSASKTQNLPKRYQKFCLPDYLQNLMSMCFHKFWIIEVKESMMFKFSSQEGGEGINFH